MTGRTVADPSDRGQSITGKKTNRPRTKAKFTKRVQRFAERLNRSHARFGDVPVLDNADFPWVAQVEAQWRPIRAELDRLLQRQAELPAFNDVVGGNSMVSHHLRRDRGWKSFFLLGYGHRFQRNIAQCPETWRVLKTIPGLKTAMFSILEPGKHIPLHRDPYNGVLRFHLGLIVPEPQSQVAIRIDGQLCHWQEGKGLIFDDRFEHEAWNATNSLRAVLFVDFVKPLRFPANLVNRAVIAAAPLTRSVRESRARHRAWEATFYSS